MEINIGIAAPQREKIADGLSRLLADTYTLYLKTHNFHWNVTGPMFNTLHLMFEGQYNELALAVDLIAERIRALGLPAPGSYREFSKLTSIKESTGSPDANEMIRQLAEGQEAVVRTARSVFPDADGAHDEPTTDLLTQRMQVHEKNAWMLRSLLEK
jgi:starvation-inducible DNA-binding protein